MTRKVLVGMLLLGALFVFGLATFYVKNWQFHVGKGYRLVANFPVVHTLDTGDVVRMAGVVVGTVEELTISTEAATQFPVRAVLWIREGVVVRADDQASIRMTSVFGGSFVAIERGDPQAQPLSDGDTLEPEDLPEHVRVPNPNRDFTDSSDDLSVKRRVAELERHLIQRALDRTGGNKTRAAELLELSPRALRYKLHDYGLKE
jgi:ABC-type transporter Mla subunit MlaD